MGKLAFSILFSTRAESILVQTHTAQHLRRKAREGFGLGCQAEKQPDTRVLSSPDGLEPRVTHFDIYDY